MNTPEYDNINDKLTLLFLIMQERRNPDTKIRNFLDSLPTDWSNFPVLYSDEELELLEGSVLA